MYWKPKNANMTNSCLDKYAYFYEVFICANYFALYCHTSVPDIRVTVCGCLQNLRILDGAVNVSKIEDFEYFYENLSLLCLLRYFRGHL